MTPTAQQLAKARQSLLDLTLRNRLLNYRSSKVRSVPIVGESPAEVFDALVLREKPLTIRGIGRRAPRGNDAAESPVKVWLTGAAWVRSSVAGDNPHQVDRFLQAPLDDEALEKKLFHVYHEGHSIIEEQGYSVVHLALGFLEWFESDESAEVHRAPLLLVPAELERVHAGNFSRLTWTGEDVFGNISLAAKLSEQGVILPPFDAPEEKGGIDDWLAGVMTAVARKPRWRVTSDMVLDLFSFTKFVMFKDLDPAAWPVEQKPEDHALLRALFEPESGASAEEGFLEEDIDRKLTARDVLHVMDADPSQVTVMQDVKAGRNLVVQGPPGTGKSQTITNLISEALGAGKTVLFVSEKLAALNVVKSRLDAAGLQPFCLELHSRKANRKAVLEELKRSLMSTATGNPGEQMLGEYEQLKQDLNRYAEDLGSVVGLSGRTAFQWFAERQRARAGFEAADRAIPNLPSIPSVAALSNVKIVESEKAVRETTYILPMIAPVESHAWRHSRVESMLPHEEGELREELEMLAGRLNVLRAANQDLELASGVSESFTLDQVARACKAAALIQGSMGRVDFEILLSSEWNERNPMAEELIARVEAWQRARTSLEAAFHDSAIDGHAVALVAEFRPLAVRFFRFFNPRFRELRRELGALFRAGTPPTRQMVEALETLVEVQRERDVLRQDRGGLATFGSRWQGEKSHPSDLRNLVEFLVDFRRELMAHVLTSRSVELVSGGNDRSKIERALHATTIAAQSLSEGIHEFAGRVALNLDMVFASGLHSASFEETESQIRTWAEHLVSLFPWSRGNAARAALRMTAAAPIDSLISDGTLSAADLEPAFRLALAESLLRAAFAERPSLARFVGEAHERKIARFQQLDRDLITLNRARLSRRLHDTRPRLVGGVAPGSEAGILLGEFNRKRNHLKIRQLLIRAGHLVQKIKPCFLMSPLSVAQFLDARGVLFDLIVFDEASQVRPEDALGALLRGKQLVVMGDSQQLPPTSFFDHLIAGDEGSDADEEGSVSVADLESILHQCERSFPSKMLNWHYRSRHESLIATSNFHFYQNRLRIYPSAVDREEELGLHFVHLPQTIYDRGKSATNREEAKVVVAAVMRHFRTWGDRRSLGVGTFSMKQQQTILEEIELQLLANPDMEPFFKSDREESFFVKNLETIQGDERDVILISVGYGRDAQGRLSMNFGPVTKNGGERRLNVLITRARQKCVVFSNITYHDISLESTSSRGVFALKSFLEFAETRRLTAEAIPLEDTDSPFEDAVAEVLAAHGHEVRKQVGCAGFRVDLAVVDPSNRGSYLLAVECDGAKYHSAPVARDRDRLRQQILESLGWRIHRIWSTDWYRNRRETVERLLRAVEGARTPRVPASEGLPQPVTTEPSVENAAPAPVIKASWIEEISLYSTCTRISSGYDEYDAESIARCVDEVVRIEGPIHFDEVVRRLRTLWGFDRAGSRIQAAVGRGVALAVSRGRIKRRGEFLTIPGQPPPLRRRAGDPSPRIDLIAPEEIEMAVKCALEVQFAMAPEDAAVQASRALGFGATRDCTSTVILSVINGMVTRGELVRDGHVLRLPEDLRR